MDERLPPLNALRAFEAAARHLNMSRAAEELFVTPAAVSHQIIALEKHLGRQLFERRQHGLALTQDGARYLPFIRTGFDNLRQAAKALEVRKTALVVAAPPAFSTKWLMPQLRLLSAEFPSISIINDTAETPADRLPEKADVAIRYGAGRFGALMSYRLLDEFVIPVCHPDLRDKGPAIVTAEDLLKHKLLHGRESLPGEGFPDWQQWFAWAGVRKPLPESEVEFDHHLTTVQAALEAQGIALVKRSIVMTDLIRGNLIQLTAAAYPLSFAHYLVHPRQTEPDEVIEKLRHWLDRSLAQTLCDLPAALIVR